MLYFINLSIVTDPRLYDVAWIVGGYSEDQETASSYKAIPLTGRGGPYGCETSRFPHLDNQLTDGGEVVSLTRRPPFTPQEDFWYSFLLDAESTSGS
jgi:hypothetical protein